MKSKMFQEMIGNIDDDLIVAADRKVVPMKKKTLKWISGIVAACLVAVCAIVVIPTINKPVEQTGEYKLESFYKYAVDEGEYKDYEPGKVIADEKIGGKLADVTVTAGWVDYLDGEKWDATEHAKAEIYEISGIFRETAVAIKFIDKLEAESTECYYVIINPAADKTPVKDYVIVIDGYSSQDNEAANEAVPE